MIIVIVAWFAVLTLALIVADMALDQAVGPVA